MKGSASLGSFVRRPTRGENSEEMLLRQVLNLAAMNDWKAFHVTNSTRLVKRGISYVRASNLNPQGVGFPDLVLAHATRGLIFAELKRDKGPRGGGDGVSTSAEQDEWIATLRAAGQEVYVWRPADLDTIAARLALR